MANTDRAAHWTYRHLTTTTPEEELVLRILVVDDNSEMRRVLAWILTDQGFAVEVAETGQQALALAAAHAPDGVLLDLELGSHSRISGAEVCQQLRQQGLTAPIIIMSAQPTAVVEHAMQSGAASGYLLKPFRIATFVEQLHSHLALHTA